MTTNPPRLCHIRKRQDFEGYGFRLQAEKGMEGQFIGCVEAGSPAENAGLKEGDKLIEVNGVNVLRETHFQVVERIKGVEFETKFLVVDTDSWLHHKKQGTTISADMPSVVKLFSEPESKFEYLARVCHLCTWDNFQGYGFNLHYHKDLKKHVIGKVDEASPARSTGLLEGDIIVEVNGVNVQSTSHKDVVDKITENPKRVSLLVVGASEEEYFKTKGISIGSWMVELRHLHCCSNKEEKVQAPQPQPPSKEEEEQRKAEEDAIKAVENSVSPHRLRLSHLKLWGDGNGYGFNMQSEKKKVGQYISNVDPNSPADLGGLRNGDMILAVNGTSVKELKHQEVVALIKQNLKEASLLLVDEVSKTHLEEAGLPLYEQDKMIDYIDTIVVPESNNTKTETESKSLEKNVENEENEKIRKPEIILDVSSIQSSGIYDSQKIVQSSVGSGEVPVSTKHVPSPTVVVSSPEFASSAQEARQRLAKKKQASQEMSVQARYEIYNKL